jgi:hypothetical protein
MGAPRKLESKVIAHRILSTTAYFAASEAHSTVSSLRCWSMLTDFSLSAISGLSGSISNLNLSLHSLVSLGYSFIANSCTVTVISLDGHTTPTLGRTEYRFGLVVLTLNA